MFRLRDFAAALAVVVLAKLALEDPSDSLAATVQLSYYVRWQDTGSTRDDLHRLVLMPVVLDVDGDGTVEALASLLQDENSKTWKMEVLDLKPAASTDKIHAAPFRPKTLYQSEPIFFTSHLNTTNERPLQMTTGHVILQDKSGRNQKSDGSVLSLTHYKNVELNERNRKYFCGNDWHHAAQSCAVPCPGGSAAECPEGQHCYADTPCDVSNIHKQESSKNNNNKDELTFSVNDLLVTPAGGLPSVFSFWSNGVLAMHSLTGDFPSNATHKSIKRSKAKELIGLRQMWQTLVIPKEHIVPHEWTGVSLSYIDATDASDNSGMVVVQAHLIHFNQDDDEQLEETLTMAFDAESGKKVWDVSHHSFDDDSQGEAGNDKPKPVKLPLVSSVQSQARRRSLKPHVQTKKSENMVSNCLHAYRRSILTSDFLMPHFYYGELYASTRALHFEQQEHNLHAIHSKKQKKSSGSLSTDSSKSSWKDALSPFKRNRRDHHVNLKRGKPNVLASKNENGIEIRSLKNGRSVCHLSLWYDTLYTDLNHDGVLDSVFAVTGDHLVQDDDKLESNEDEKWISKLVGRLKDSKMLEEDTKANDHELDIEDKSQRLCHLMALSGFPAKEELFAVNLCGNNNHLKEQPEALDPAPLLAVESAHGKGQDVIVALNDKTVQRVRGKSGRRMWQLNGKLHTDFPTWENGYISILQRIDAPNVPRAARPLILTGDASLAVISVGHGRVLATAALPQPALFRPILVDFNGDGTTDVVVVTKDAVWGYRVTIMAASFVPFRFIVGLLVVGIMLAILRNRFGPFPGKRSTDA